MVKNEGKTIVRLNTVILIKVKLQFINYVALHARVSNELRGNAVRLGIEYVCDCTHYVILNGIFSRE